ncbi:uncharacterized protein LOC115965249 [Quercus lobata]|uniref:uncharacterized protein LOC115965249 n=1 Tax=Quercus lobata TaxID=97700 RepID=UPI00124923E3|nr:uncharacterized protein LOC115965249 [Quercus lobata]
MAFSIEVIPAAPRGATITRRGVLTVAPKETCTEKQPLEKRMKVGRLPISFDEDDLEGMIQPHDDALIQGSFEAQDSRMKEYLRAAMRIINKFRTVKVAQVGRAQNRHTDSLATLTSLMTEEVPRLIKVELIREPSISVGDNYISTGVEVAIISITRPYWMDPIIDFLAEDRVPDDDKEAKKIRRVASRYWLLVDRKLYWRSFGEPYLSCLHPEKKDVAEYVQKCEQCQKHAPLNHQPVGHLNPISSPWPFAQWGLDILGPFPRATGNRWFVLVAVGYFMKWAEAEALANIRDVDIKKYSTLAYPQSNDQAEATNKTILNGLKRRLDGAKGRWAEELPNVLWAYHTTPRRSTREIPFSLTYGAEAVIPAEVNLCSAQVAGFDPAENDELMLERLDWLKECQEAAIIRLAKYQQKLAQRYN